MKETALMALAFRVFTPAKFDLACRLCYNLTNWLII
jgi:hypothetical protein